MLAFCYWEHLSPRILQPRGNGVCNDHCMCMPDLGADFCSLLLCCPKLAHAQTDSWVLGQLIPSLFRSYTASYEHGLLWAKVFHVLQTFSACFLASILVMATDFCLCFLELELWLNCKLINGHAIKHWNEQTKAELISWGLRPADSLISISFFFFGFEIHKQENFWLLVNIPFQKWAAWSWSSKQNLSCVNPCEQKSNATVSQAPAKGKNYILWS